jgi:CBS domain-containing protein
VAARGERAAADAGDRFFACGHTSLPGHKIDTKSSLTEPGMSLKTILAAKGGNTICIEPTADLAAAAKLLTTHRIGALVVLDAGGRLVGILSERDIVRTMANGGSAVLQLPVGQVMTRNVSTCDVNDSIGSVVDRMTKGKFRHMPVLDKDRLAGLVSIGDVLKWQIEMIRENIHQLEVSIAEFELMKL